ncbi:hypothetical protein QJ529_03930 [Bacillus paranthracis]|uniref:hypothetical protein n=1 Tax=Bacillus TaxID=1386 RepID=UPI000CCBDDC5|nr:MULTISPECIES: hypothetical protein [Bacillus]MDO3371811.1 hypothetical protein [Bacillus paranthracis]PNS33925.1 hypothetical protein C1640_05480 [Bacillus sp. AKBS9]GCF66939.1 hypothetical protein BC2903_07580 [Bacillus cereus]
MSDIKLTNEVISPKDKRDSLVDKVEVLSKVKEFSLPPELEMATLQQVADFYEVPKKMITNLLESHKDELVSDGYMYMKGNKISSFFPKMKRRGSYTVTSRNGEKYTYSSGESALFPKRAILRVGMLLGGASEVAKKIRAQLLNTEESAVQLYINGLVLCGLSLSLLLMKPFTNQEQVRQGI